MWEETERKILDDEFHGDSHSSVVVFAMPVYYLIEVQGARGVFLELISLQATI